MRDRLSQLAVGCVALALVPLIGLSDLSLQARLGGVAEVGERYYIPPPRLLKGLCFGYNELAADLVWLRTIVYFTDRLVSDRDYRHLASYVETTLALDDHIKEVFRFAPSMFTLRGARQTNAQIWAAIRILERGHERFPGEYRFAFNLGALYMNDLRTKSPTERARWDDRAATWLHRASLLGNDVPWLPSLVARLRTKAGKRDLAIRHLQELYLTTQDPAMKRHIAGKLRSMHASQLADELKTEGERFTRLHRETLPYVSADLFVHVRLDPLPPFSLSAPAP